MKTGDFAGKADKDFFGKVNAPMKPLGNKPTVPAMRKSSEIPAHAAPNCGWR